MFEPHELVGRNVSGVRGKKPQDGRKIGKIKENVNQCYPARSAEALLHLRTGKTVEKRLIPFCEKLTSRSHQNLLSRTAVKDLTTFKSPFSTSPFCSPPCMRSTTLKQHLQSEAPEYR
jgi:hypothetical protein